MKLLAGHRIDTGEQLFSYQDSLTGKIEALTADRKELYRKQRTVAVKSDDTGLAEVKASIAALSKGIGRTQTEVKCDDIAARSGVMREKIKAVRGERKISGKEKNAMNNSGDAAEQVIGLSLEGTEVALKAHRFRRQKHCRRHLCRFEKSIRTRSEAANGSPPC